MPVVPVSTPQAPPEQGFVAKVLQVLNNVRLNLSRLDVGLIHASGDIDCNNLTYRGRLQPSPTRVALSSRTVGPFPITVSFTKVRDASQIAMMAGASAFLTGGTTNQVVTLSFTIDGGASNTFQIMFINPTATHTAFPYANWWFGAGALAHGTHTLVFSLSGTNVTSDTNDALDILVLELF